LRDRDLPILLAEYKLARDKVDAAVTAIAQAAGDELACKKGCASCCTGDLSVLPVEAAAIEVHLAHAARALPEPRAGVCVFLDDEGACAVYEARPLLCRTHGVALRTPRDQGESRGALRVIGDDVEVCALNYEARPPAAAEVLDALRIQALLVTVDRRYRARVGIDDDASRVPLSALARAGR
jgi:Fe-S-cluster containining protein